jgi:outer membrane protein assembly factor BamB
MKRKPVCLLAITLLASATAAAADWPTYLGDNQRTGATAEQLELPLRQAWLFSSSAVPRRTWTEPEGRIIEGKELGDRVRFDDATFQVAAVGHRVFFGSSVDHQVRCLDLRTGKELWQFFTDAPVRLAPSVAEGRVYFGSEDGCAYCLDAVSGRLIWKLSLGPANECILARGEMISRWAVRTGVLVDRGVAYFGAGIFPHENVYLCAARAADGTILWRNDNLSHLDAGRNDLSPQGYLLATEDVLYVPSGRSRPKAISRATGEFTKAAISSLNLANTTISGTDALVEDGRLWVYSVGTHLIPVGDAYYVATGKEVLRTKRKEFTAACNERTKIAAELVDLARKLKTAGKDADQMRKRMAELRKRANEITDIGIVWRTPCATEASLIVAGDLVFVGGQGAVIALAAATGKEAWKAHVEGGARGLAVASGNLLVSTTAGKVYCFANTPAPHASAGVAATDSPYPTDPWAAVYRRAAEEILQATGVKRGYCLVVGNEQGRLAFELAKRSELEVFAVEPDERKVRECRQVLSAAGLYGNRITVHHANLNAIPYSNYFANLIVSDSLLLTGTIPGDPGELARHLKPAGGVIALGRPAKAPGAALSETTAKAWLAKMRLSDHSQIRTAGSWLTLTRGMLPGAGKWTHQYADAGNTANSGDQLVKGGLGVLWYGDPGQELMVNRHMGAVGPLVVNGRMFIQGENCLMAYDAFNGQSLWRIDNPHSIRTGVYQNRNPGNLAANDERLFHMARAKVYEHDGATGEVKRLHDLPASVDPTTHEWGYVAVRDGLLLGTATTRAELIELNLRRRGYPGDTATDSIFAIDAATGKHLWWHQGQSINFQTIARGPNRVFFIDSSVTSEQREAILRQDKSELAQLEGPARQNAEDRLKALDVRLAVALDATTGQKLWSTPVDVTDCSEIGIGGGKLTMMYHDGVLVLCGANANGHYWKQFVAGDFSRRRLVALSAQDGHKLWGQDANYRHRPIIIGDRIIAEPWAYDLKSGAQKTREHPLTGSAVPWSFMRPGHHCGALSACDNMLVFRSGHTGFFDLLSDAGTRHFAGHRPGCWINAIPASGLVVMPEASAGCVCLFSIASTIVLEPRPARRPWSLYSGVGATTPVKHVALNFGAPGDRRDRNGRLWLAYPRPVPNTSLETSLDLKLKFETEFQPDGGFFTNDGDASERSPAELAWVVSSGARGMKRLVLPLRSESDGPGMYTLRLIFASMADDKPGQRVFDVRVGGELSCKGVDVAAESGRGVGFVVREVNSVAVSHNLVIELSSGHDKPTPLQMPILCGLEVARLPP